jgi:hypothetical protein
VFSVDPETGLPQISETQILEYSRLLSEDIGYRTVGTAEHALADKWMAEKAYEVQSECERLVQLDPGCNLECEVWHQRGSGSHRYVPAALFYPLFAIFFRVNHTQVRHDG